MRKLWPVRAHWFAHIGRTVAPPTITIFDEHLAWEKPCGGGLTHKAIQRFPFLLDNPYPKKLIHSIELIASNEQRAMLEMTNPS